MAAWEAIEMDKYCAHWGPGADTTTFVKWKCKTLPSKKFMDYMKQYKMGYGGCEGEWYITFTLPINSQKALTEFYESIKKSFGIEIQEPESWCQTYGFGGH